MVGMVNEGRTNELEQVFYKELEQVAYNPDKSIEEQLRDLIADFKAMPENSLERELQREIILAHVQKNKGGKSVVDNSLS
jgi:predicted DNA-binding ribbon-helix-helix protein